MGRLPAETADLVGFLSEIGTSRGRALPAFGSALLQAAAPGQAAAPKLRPPERMDDGAKARLEALRDEAGPLPRLAVLIAAPPGGRLP